MRWLLLFLLSFAASSTWAADGYKLFPVAGLFEVKESDTGSSKIEADFSLSVPGEQGGRHFSDKFRIAFPDAVMTIDNANKRRTFAVSLQIVRASKYVIHKPDGTDDIYLPITGSIYFTNVMTGEVLFTLTRTEIKVASLKRDVVANGSQKIQTLFRENFEELVDVLIRDAQSQFRPVTISAVVRSEWKGLAILDGGREQGISREDTLIDQQGTVLKVLSSGPNYSIAKVELGPMSIGSTFSKVTNQTLAEIKRPRVLPIIDATPVYFPFPTLLVQLLSDALGSKSAISLDPVNPTYQQVLTTVAAKMVDVSQEQTRQREFPNFFFRLNIPEPIEYEVATNVAYKTRHVYEAIAFAELVERSGRVLYAGFGRNRIEDEVTAGMTFNSSDRKDVVIKNAIVDLANRFSSEMKFINSEAAVSVSGKEVFIQDDLRMLTKGANWRVYRSIGKVGGIKEDVRVPTWDVRVSEVLDGKVKANLDLPVVDGAPEPSVGDVVFLNGVSGDGFFTRKSFGPCAAVQLGEVKLPEYGYIAQNIFASRFKAAYYSVGLNKRAEELIRSGSGFKSDLKIQDVSFDYCVEPVYRIDKVEPKCDANACADVANIRLTYRIRKDTSVGEIKVRQGLETKMTTGMLAKTTSESVKASALRADMLDEVLKLNSDIILSLKKETY